MVDIAKRVPLHRLALLLGMGIFLSWLGGPSSSALEPPRPGQIEQYRKDGTLAERVAAAEALGNHRVAPRLLLDARNRLHNLVTGEDHPEAFTPPTCWQGGLPSHGNPKILTLLIAFSDTPPVTGDTQPLIDSKLFGDGTAGPPNDSLRNYYRRSSYDQLDIGGNALGWYTTAYPRSSVSQTDTGRENLIKEALSYYDSQGHDFSQYDNDGDGRIDYFAVIWTGTHGAWASFWWGYQTGFYDPSYVLDGKTLGAYSWQWESYNYPSGLFEPSTLIHETGHALGLPDYYDYDGSVGPDGGVGGLDMMDGYGDHNCFSKFLLDWISPAVCNATGAHIATLHPSESSQDAIIAMPDASGSPFEEYFMIQVRNRTQNDIGYPTDGILIWHVDARLDGSGCDYLYDNSYTTHKLLRLMEADGLEEIERNYGADAGDYYTQGDSFGNSTVPNSKRYGGTPTGLTLNAISAYADPMTFNLDCAACTLTCTASVPAAGLVGQALAFQSTATFSPAACGTATFSWDFDNDGVPDSTQQNPSHAYATAGTYTWKLTVIGTNTAEICTRTGTVTVTVPCVLTCSATVPSQGYAGIPVYFRSTAGFSPAGCGTATFSWDFDNNGISDSSQQNPAKTYTTPGTYMWRLVVGGTNGSGACTQSGTITIVEPCTLSCTAEVPPAATAGQTVDFQASATGSDCTGSPSYAWTFGDGGSSAGQDASHTYSNAGTFPWSVTVTVEGTVCTQTGSILVTSPCTLDCTAVAPATATSGQTVAFQATATASHCAGNPTYSWAFGDGAISTMQNPTHAYASAGSYTWSVTVTVEGETCSKTGTIAVAEPCTVTCAATVPAAGRAGDEVPFSAVAEATHCAGTPQFAWVFGDGGTSAEQNPAHTYLAAGGYSWSLTVTADGRTCTQAGSIVVTEACAVTCTAEVAPTSGGFPLAVAFAATAAATNCNGSPTYAWSFGDGGTSTEQNPNHTYSSAGSFPWTLVVTADGKTCVQTGTVIVAAPCVLACEASADPSAGNAPLTVSFAGSATATNCTGEPAYAWSFGDGGTSQEQNPSHIYAAAGNFTWTLTVTAGGATCTRTGTAAVEPGIPGDGDGDGAVSIGEVQQAVNMFLGTQTPGNGVDCDGDGVVSIGEVQKVMNAFLGIATSC